MALNIKNSAVERLVSEVASLAGETKTEAVRKALEERKGQLAFRVVRRDRKRELLRFLEEEVWKAVPRGELGRRLGKRAEESLLGFGADGV